MGERLALGVVAVLVACGLSGAGAPVQAATVQAAPAAPTKWHLSRDMDPDLADKFVAETPHAAPDALGHHWASCSLPININYAVGPGVDADDLRNQLAYPVRYLQGLGYYAAIGVEVPYVVNAPVPNVPGEVLVVVERDSPSLRAKGWRAVSSWYGEAGALSSASVLVDFEGGLSSDVLLHEFGHIVGLDHKPGSVMGLPASDAPVFFDAAETAAIDCRNPATAGR